MLMWKQLLKMHNDSNWSQVTHNVNHFNLINDDDDDQFSIPKHSTPILYSRVAQSLCFKERLSAKLLI